MHFKTGPNIEIKKEQQIGRKNAGTLLWRSPEKVLLKRCSRKFRKILREIPVPEYLF